MSEEIAVLIDGQSVAVAAGTSVAAAVLQTGRIFRRSLTGEPRAALCGMGICFECRVTINGEAHCRSCQTPCETGMRIVTAS